MRILKLFLVLFLYASASFGQEHSCSKAHNYSRKLKSATLNSSDLSRMEKYDLTYLLMDLNVSNKSTEISGFVSLRGYFKSEVDSILLELLPDFTIDSVLVNRKKSSFLRNENLLKIPNSASNFIVSVYYHGSKNNNQENFIGGSGVINGVDTYNKTNTSVTYTLSEPFSAYEWWPSKQSLSDKIDSADLYFTTTNPNLVGSNGMLVEKIALSNNQTTFHWKTSYPTTYYLFSFSVAPYKDYSFKKYISKAKDSLLVQNYIYNDQNFLNSNKWFINKTGDFIDFYSNIFSIYPFMNEKYGHCLSTIGGGMEHQTMTTLISFDLSLVAHELAHQWFGDHVTCASYADIWLNEGFASYAEYLMFESFFPTNKTIWLNNKHANAKKDKFGSVFVKDTTDENRIFSSDLTYDKGGSIIHILRNIIHNDSLFFKGLQYYQQTFAHSFGTIDGFKKSMEKSTGLDLTNFFNEWYYGEGYPIYSFQSETTDSTRIYIHHTTSSSFTHLFTTPVELLLSLKNGNDTIVRFPITSNKDTFVFDKNIGIESIKTFDPNNYLIFETSPYLKITDLMKDIVKIGPNPTSDFINVLTKQPIQYELTIYDILGNLILNQSHISESKLNTKELKSGVYLVQLKSANSQFIQRIIIE
jgi:aminopeptidase N